mmetsp:Transcript_994/g.2055  ORF Transcript_994/g.2055 Transcript_994/m.2055 type:complete len:238 (-) Transcript_994:1211-1924(-)
MIPFTKEPSGFGVNVFRRYFQVSVLILVTLEHFKNGFPRHCRRPRTTGSRMQAFRLFVGRRCRRCRIVNSDNGCFARPNSRHFDILHGNGRCQAFKRRALDFSRYHRSHSHQHCRHSTIIFTESRFWSLHGCEYLAHWNVVAVCRWQHCLKVDRLNAGIVCGRNMSELLGQLSVATRMIQVANGGALIRTDVTIAVLYGRLRLGLGAGETIRTSGGMGPLVSLADAAVKNFLAFVVA